MKTWTKPEYQLIDMNAEIGSYQEDFGEERDPVAAAGKAGGAVGDEREPVVATAARSDQGGVPAGGASA
jgi:hypothetical protein